MSSRRIFALFLPLTLLAALLGGIAPAQADPEEAQYDLFIGSGVILGEKDTVYAARNATVKWKLYGNHLKFVWEKRDATAPAGYTRSAETIVDLPDDAAPPVFTQKMPGSYTGKPFLYRVRVYNLDGVQIALSGWQRYMTLTTPYKASKSTYSRWSLVTGGRTKPGRWDSCSDITVKLDARSVKNGSQARAERDTKSAISYIRKHTGVRLVYKGRIKESSSERDFSFSNDIVVKWVSGGPKGTAGKATVKSFGVPGNAPWRSIDKAKISVYTRYDKSSRRQHVLRHELFHSVGAGHSKSNKDMMGPSGSKKTFQYGDKIVANYVGKRAGCM